MRAYSQDLRDRVIAAHKENLSISAITALFNICRATAKDWIARYIATGDYGSKQGTAGQPPYKFDNKELLIDFIRTHPDADGIEIRDAVAPDLAMSTFYDTLARMGITYKKKEPKYKERKETDRKEFIEQMNYIDQDKLVFVDETGIDKHIVPQYGWAVKGTRTYAEQTGFKTERLNIVAGYRYGTKSIIAPFEYSGYTDTNLLNGWFEQQLIPALNTGDIVILDNASFHKDPELQEMASTKGIRIIYLPAYSPDLNPIEKFWANLKRNIRKIIKKYESFQETITLAFNTTISC